MGYVKGSVSTSTVQPGSEAARDPVRVSILIATRNNPSTLRKAVETCFAQALSGGSFEILIFDDVSDPPQQEVLTALEEDHRREVEEGRLTIVRSAEPFGASGGRNQIAPLARGEILAVMDGDAYPEPDWLERAVACFEDSDVGVVASRVVFDGDHDLVNGMGATLSRYGFGIDHYVFQPVQNLPEEPEDVLFAMGCGMFIRRTVWDQLDGFDELFKWGYEDTDFSLRAWVLGYRTVTQPRAVVFHDTFSFDPPNRHRIYYYTRHRWLFVLKHWPWLWVMKTLVFQVVAVLFTHDGRVHSPLYAKAMLSLAPDLPGLLRARRHRADRALLERVVWSQSLPPQPHRDLLLLHRAPLTPIPELDWGQADTYRLAGGFYQPGAAYVSVIDNGWLDLALLSTSCTVTVTAMARPPEPVTVSARFTTGSGDQETMEAAESESGVEWTTAIPAEAVHCRLTFTSVSAPHDPITPPPIIQVRRVTQG